MGTGYIVGSIYGRDVEQVVHKSPDATYSAIKDAVGNIPAHGTTFFEGGTPMPYELDIAAPADNRLHLTLTFADRIGAEADIEVRPQAGADESLVAAKFHGDRAVLQAALAGTDKARLAYAPDWMLNLAARPVLRQVAEQIERGEPSSFGLPQGHDERAEWEAKLTPEQREQQAEWQQYQATRPSTDTTMPPSSQ